jgi:hypothetical protein
MASTPLTSQTDKEFLLHLTNASATTNDKTLDDWGKQQVRYTHSRWLIVLALTTWIFIVAWLAIFIIRIPSFLLFAIFIATCITVIWIDLKIIKKILRCPNCQAVPFLIERKGFLRFKTTIVKDKSSCLYCGIQLTRHSNNDV